MALSWPGSGPGSDWPGFRGKVWLVGCALFFFFFFFSERDESGQGPAEGKAAPTMAMSLVVAEGGSMLGPRSTEVGRPAGP